MSFNGATIVFILEEVKEAILVFSQGIMRVLKLYFALISIWNDTIQQCKCKII